MVQKKGFTKWANVYLGMRKRRIEDLYTDFNDGVNLIHLLEVIGQEPIGRKWVAKPKVRRVSMCVYKCSQASSTSSTLCVGSTHGSPTHAYMHNTLLRCFQMRIQRLENVGTALKYLTKRGVQLTNCSPNDIVDGNGKIILGMMWTYVCVYCAAVTGWCVLLS